MLTDSVLRWALLISVMMMLSQQFSGINVAIYYSSEIFRSAGFYGTGAQAATLSLGALNVCMTFVSVLLIDRHGRRRLHLTGLCVMWASSVALVTSLVLLVSYATTPIRVQNAHVVAWANIVCVVAMLTFVLGFATGPGSIPWFFVSELFADDARANANSVAVCVNWLANFCVGQFFLTLKARNHTDSLTPCLQSFAGDYSMLLFTAALTIFIAFTYKFVPETKGKTTQEIQLLLERRAVR